VDGSSRGGSGAITAFGHPPLVDLTGRTAITTESHDNNPVSESLIASARGHYASVAKVEVGRRWRRRCRSVLRDFGPNPAPLRIHPQFSSHPRPALSLSYHDQLRPRLNANGHLSRTSRSPDMILEMCPVYPTGRNTLLQVAFVSCSACTHGIRQLRNGVSWRPPILQR
jgi:hypothetical protein